MNTVNLVGRLTRDPDAKNTSNGNMLTTFTIAVDRPYKGANGERGTDFPRIVTWRKLAEICEKNLCKGRLVAVQGRLQTRNYEDQNGQRKSIVEVIADSVQFLDSRKNGQSNNQAATGTDGNSSSNFPFDDDLPF